MRDLLNTFYAIHISEEILIEDRVAYQCDNHIYFITLATNNKAIHMEQSLLAYYLVEKGYDQTAHPVPNNYGEWITHYRDENYLVLKVTCLKNGVEADHGKELAQFHRINSAYTFEPQHVSSYGQWKQLWIEKLTYYEKKIIEEAKEQIQSAKNQLSSQEKQLESKKASTNSQIQSAKNELENAKKELQEAEAELEKQKQDVNKQLEEAESKIIDAKAEISEIENPEWYILVVCSF